MKPAAAATVALAFLVSGQAWAAPTSPVYFQTWDDAVTGFNQFTADGGQRWYVTPGADNYDLDIYERPTAQTYEMRNHPDLGMIPAANEYFGYLDIKQGSYGYDNQYMYFSITLNTGVRITSNGNMDAESFGSGTNYVIRLSSASADGASGLLLRFDGASKELWTNTFQTKTGQGFWDQNGDVGGPGGIIVTNENPGSMNGFETELIKSDGGLENNTSNKVLFARIVGPQDGQPIDPDINPVVEIAFDYLAFNAAYPNAAVDPTNLLFLDFEANRGTKDNQNYLWNDKYSLSQAGSPYSVPGLGNVYELDTLRAIGIPEPGSLALLGFSALMLLHRRH